MKRDVALIALLLSFAGPFAAQAGTTMETKGKGFAPPAFYSFCSRQPGLCSTSGGKKVVALQPRQRRAELLARKHAVVHPRRELLARVDHGDSAAFAGGSGAR